jgi:hypothetical protein
MLDELIARFGSAAVVTARPHMLDSGDTYRWELEIDRKRVPIVSAYKRKLPGSTSGRVLVMRYGDDEIEIGRCSTKNYRYGPAAIVDTLGGLKRRAQLG